MGDIVGIEPADLGPEERTAVVTTAVDLLLERMACYRDASPTRCFTHTCSKPAPAK